MPASLDHPNQSMPLIGADVASMRNAAEADPRVAALLGARWGLSMPTQPPKSKVSAGLLSIRSSRFTRLTYF